MELRPIPARDWADWYTQELCASFPACECKPLEAIRALAAEGRYELLGLYDGAALLGYATLWSTPEWPDYVLLDYLGVTAARRNGGLGAELLRLLREKFRSWDGIIVESEAPEGGQSDGIRQRRMNFYRRNGYTFLRYDCMLFGVHYRVCLCSPNGKGSEEATMAAHQALYGSQFPGWAYRRFIQIPRDPDAPLQPKESWAEQRGLPGLEEDEKGREQ